MTDDKQQVRRTLAGPGRLTPIGQGDHLYDALRAAAMLFPKPKIPGRRRAIFALTNDAERNSKTSGEALITELLEADATANAIVLVSSKASVRTQGRLGLPIPGLPEVNVDAKLGASRPGGDSVREVVEATGGDVIPGDLLHERLPEAVRRLPLDICSVSMPRRRQHAPFAGSRCASRQKLPSVSRTPSSGHVVDTTRNLPSDCNQCAWAKVTGLRTAAARIVLKKNASYSDSDAAASLAVFLI